MRRVVAVPARAGKFPAPGRALDLDRPERMLPIQQREPAIMPRSLGIVTAFCLLAASCVTATSSVEAKQRSFAAGKDRANVAVAANRKTVKRKAVTRQAARRKSLVRVKQVSPIAIPRTPVDKNDCIGAAQTSYANAQVLFRRKKQSIPRDFEQVISKLNQFCGEEEFEKARISLEWMNRCLAESQQRLLFCR